MLGGGEPSQEAGADDTCDSRRRDDQASVVDGSEGRSSVATQRFGFRGRKMKR